MWFRYHTTLFLAIGSGLVLVELSVLLSAIFLCSKLPKYRRYTSESRDPGLKSTWRWLLPECGSEWQVRTEGVRDQQRVHNRNTSDYSSGMYRDVGACINSSERNSAGKGRFANAIPLRTDTCSSSFRTEPGRAMTQTLAGTVCRSPFSRSGTYTLRCNLNPLALDADVLNKRKCIYEKNISTHPGTAKFASLQSRFSAVEEHPEVGEGSDSMNSMMWWVTLSSAWCPWHTADQEIVQTMNGKI